MAPTGSFVPRKAMPPLTDAKKREQSFLCALRHPQNMLCTLGLLACLFSRALRSPSHPSPWTSKTSLWFCTGFALVAKIHKNQPLSFSQPMVLGMFSLGVSLCAPLSLTFLCYSLSPLSSTQHLFLPHTKPLHSLPSLMWPFLSI